LTNELYSGGNIDAICGIKIILHIVQFKKKHCGSDVMYMVQSAIRYRMLGMMQTVGRRARFIWNGFECR